MSIAVRKRAGSGGDADRARFRRLADDGGSRRGSLRDVSLEDKYVLEEGRILLTGLQGLVRLPLDQHRADLRRGLLTGTMISGYQGSPLGGLDKELARNRELVEGHHVRHVPGLNEELGATSAWGSQLAGQLPGSKYDGVLAMWYGKAPGLDRAADSLRHGNFVGVPAHRRRARRRGRRPRLQVLDDPERVGVAAREPPHAGLLSRQRAGGARPRPARARLLARLRAVGRLQDRHERGRRGRHRRGRARPRHAGDAARSSGTASPTSTCRTRNLLAPASLDMERTLFGPRTELALAYARENGVNRIEGARRAWLGIACAGKTYYDLMHALRALGLDGQGLERAGIRILKLGMLWPVEPEIAREFAHGLDEIIVAEEKGPVPRDAPQGGALRGGRRAAHRSASATSEASRSFRASSTSTPT